MRFCGIHLRAISKQVPKPILCIMNVKIILLELLPHLPGQQSWCFSTILHIKNSRLISSRFRAQIPRHGSPGADNRSPITTYDAAGWFHYQPQGGQIHGEIVAEVRHPPAWDHVNQRYRRPLNENSVLQFCIIVFYSNIWSLGVENHS